MTILASSLSKCSNISSKKLSVARYISHVFFAAKLVNQQNITYGICMHMYKDICQCLAVLHSTNDYSPQSKFETITIPYFLGFKKIDRYINQYQGYLLEQLG